MRPWDLDSNRAHLKDALDELFTCWGETSEFWQDHVSQKFCENHLDPLTPTLKSSFDAIGRMQQILTSMQQDCGS